LGAPSEDNEPKSSLPNEDRDESSPKEDIAPELEFIWNIAVGLTGFFASDLSSSVDPAGLYAENPNDFLGTSRSGSLEVSGLNVLADAKGDEDIADAKGDGAAGAAGSFASSVVVEPKGLNALYEAGADCAAALRAASDLGAGASVFSGSRGLKRPEGTNVTGAEG